MTNNKRFIMGSIVIAATVLCLSNAAYAASNYDYNHTHTTTNDNTMNSRGIYMGGSLGLTYLQDQEFVLTDPAYKLNITSGTELDYKSSYNINAFVGVHQGDWRGEFAINYLAPNKIDKINDLDNEISSNDVKSKANTFMLNAYHDFHLFNQPKISPYVGVGVGVASIDLYGKKINSDTDNVFAYQGIAGLNYTINQHMKVFAQYNHLATTKAEYDYNTVGKFSYYYQTNLFNVGLSYYL